MSASKPHRALSREERAIWWEAFKIAFGAALGTSRTILTRSYPAIVRVSSEAADAALASYRRAVRGEPLDR